MRNKNLLLSLRSCPKPRLSVFGSFSRSFSFPSSAMSPSRHCLRRARKNLIEKLLESLKSRVLGQLLIICTSIPAVCQQKRPVSEAPDDRVNYPSNFQVEGGCNLFLFGDYLYWSASEGGLYYAQTGLGTPTGNVPPDGTTNFDGTLKRIKPHWDNGARAGAGLNFPREGYDLVFYWTWFANHSDSSVQSDLGNTLPLWAEPDFSPFAGATNATGKWDLSMNVFDLEWGRSSWFGGHFSLRPFFGLRAAWIEQQLKAHFSYATTPVILDTLRSRADFRGGGLRAGADVRYAFPYGFSIYGIASGSLLHGQLNGNLRAKEDTFTIARTKDRPWKAISSLQLALGLGWDTHFAKDRLHIEFHVGWESNMWFSVNQMNHFLNQFSTGSYFKENNNLSTQGLVAGGRFDF